MSQKSNQEKVFYAIAQLLQKGEKNITRYKVANMVSSVDRSTVYIIIKKYSEG
ncbi:hypothetical protein Sulku_1328 [Sulfuricurvum kujiense DSM 16994]|uniref:Uncharacterized protein n=1 Tax=Sulfuricurvum kujiense (strain ATCC BAA-921 / DSM 16994 / JCM 11577 / YK-1) TaxID=709032 RepID=E4TY71_SULKY|nr:hypothetical protein [Sulfuricurvum kujiense]ADR33991.1 hypothetical protein Sulku_1328 [Sulfuricurvum kujiense DSM 16994]